MGRFIDLTGQRFGRLTVMGRAENTPSGQARWRCQCNCGKESTVAGQHLRNGVVVSCGCYSSEKSSERAIVRNTTHGKYYTRLHRIWSNMKNRCYNHKHRFYARYGGRGITVCDQWMYDFQKFWNWAISNGYQDNLSIDRIDNEKGYSPDNCRWVLQKEQARNKSNVALVEIDGIAKSLPEWCEQYGVNYYTAYDRMHKYGWTPKEALGLVSRKK